MNPRRLLVISTAVLIVIAGASRVPFSLGQQLQETSDFTADVQLGLQRLTGNSASQAQQKEIQNEDYKSTWDEFGINMLVDGNTPSAEIHKEVIQDIIQSIQTEQNYDRQEKNYLQSAQVAPEDIQATEASVGADVPPTESIDAHPSLEVNPDVSPFSAENTEQNNTEASSSAELATSTQETNSLSEPESSTTTSTAAEINASTPETDTSTMETSTTDSQIFEAILQGEQATSPTSTEPNPENTPPADATLPTDTAPPADIPLP